MEGKEVGKRQMRREETDEGNSLLLPFLERKESALGLT